MHNLRRSRFFGPCGARPQVSTIWPESQGGRSVGGNAGDSGPTPVIAVSPVMLSASERIELILLTVIGEQTAAGVGNSNRPRCTAQGSAGGGIGKGFAVAGFRFGDRTPSWDCCHQSAVLHRLSGNPARSACTDRRCLEHAVIGTASHVDSSATSIRSRSIGPAA